MLNTKFVFQNSSGGGSPASQSVYYHISLIPSFRKFGYSEQSNHLVWFSTNCYYMASFFQVIEKSSLDFLLGQRMKTRS